MSQIPRKINGKIAHIKVKTDSNEYIGIFHPTDRIVDWDEGAYSKNIAARQILMDLDEKEIISSTICIIEDSCISIGDIPHSFIEGYDSIYHLQSPYNINTPTINMGIELSDDIDIMDIINRFVDMEAKSYPTKFSLNMVRDEEIINGKIITKNRIICSSIDN